MIAVNEEQVDLHLKALASLSTMLMHEEFRNMLLTSELKLDIIKMIEKMEQYLIIRRGV